MEAKDTSPTYAAYVEKYGDKLRELRAERLGISVDDIDPNDPVDAYELEAMDPADLANALEDAVKEVLDLDLFNEESAKEEADSKQIIAVRKQTEGFFKSLNITTEEQ
jgi:hypothetical protein